MLAPGRQAGITVISLLILVVLFGTIGFAGLKIFPLYVERMKIRTVLQDVQTELGAGGNTVTGIRNALDARLNIDSLDVTREQMEIARNGDGYVIRIDKEVRASFIADLWFLVIVDEEVQIGR
jgi:hypothetical protein